MKRSQAQQGEPMRMARACHQFPWALTIAFGTSAAHEAAMVQEKPEQVQVRVAQMAAQGKVGAQPRVEVLHQRPPSTLAPSSKPPAGRYLLFAEREELAILRAQGRLVREIVRRLERAARPSRGSCGATPPLGAVAWSIGPPRRSGMPSGLPAARNRRNPT